MTSRSKDGLLDYPYREDFYLKIVLISRYTKKEVGNPSVPVILHINVLSCRNRGRFLRVNIGTYVTTSSGDRCSDGGSGKQLPARPPESTSTEE